MNILTVQLSKCLIFTAGPFFNLTLATFINSNSVMSGAFESQWWRKPYCRKEMNILTVQLSKCLIFTAGPFFNLTLATFINILKGASSYYTLITKSRNED
uniref:Putative odorant receptor 41 n=1 Tax=Conopomorpha sinensis TaxID=940481 RepID=A0A3Q8HE83_9NEOP|nr:putative odorant receptor 41 [Conopomorpha sinensis]